VDDRLHPVVHPLLQDMLGFVPPEPPTTVLDIVDAWTAEHAEAVTLNQHDGERIT
jgi:hypothetical protein